MAPELPSFVGERYLARTAVHLARHANRFLALEAAIERAGLLEELAARAQHLGKAKSELRIVIKMNLMTATSARNFAAFTDPLLVAALVQSLQRAGYRHIWVGDAENIAGEYFQGRTVAAVADMVGLVAQGFTIADFTLPPDTTETATYWGSMLGTHPAHPLWRDADYRISFAKNKTHFQTFYTACMKNCYGALPLADKMRHYHGRRREFDVAAIEQLTSFEVHFGILDAYWSGDGIAGHYRDPEPNHTETLFASRSIYALDWVAGLKMGVSPEKNRVIHQAIELWGAPALPEAFVDGRPTALEDLGTWPRWTNVPAWLSVFMDALEESYGLSYVAGRAMAHDMDPRFAPDPRAKRFFAAAQRVFRVFL